MRVTGIKLTVLEPVNYYYQPSGRGNRSSTFIGDIALKYAMLHQLGEGELPEPDRFVPNYSELKKYNFWFSVAVPGYMAGIDNNYTEFLKQIIRNTMQGIDYNGSNQHPAIKVGQVMYKNFYFQQPIKPGNQFYAFFVDDGQWNLPRVLRVGTGKTGVLRLETMDPSKLKGFINLYTLNNVLQINKEKIHNRQFEFSEHAVIQYFVVGPVTEEEFQEIYSEAI